MAKKKSSGGTAHFRTIEDHIRCVLESLTGAGTSRYSAERAVELLAIIRGSGQRLEQRYDRERNPADAWEAMILLHHKATITGEALELPNWVLAYLVRAGTVIVGAAIERPELVQAGPNRGDQVKNKSRPPPPKMDRDGATSSYSDWFAGCSPKERLRLANEALGFVGDGTMNALVHAHRQRRDEELTIQISRLKREGLTDAAAAAAKNDDDALRNVEDPVRKVRRARGRKK